MWLDAIVSTIVMTFRINVDSHQKKQKFIAKIYCNNFSGSNAVVCSHLILAYTVRLPIINAAELERNGCFSIPLLRNAVLWLKRTSTKSLQVKWVTKYDTNDVKKESLVGGFKSAKWGSIFTSRFGLGVQIRCDTGITQNKENQQFRRKGCGYLSWWITIKAKFFRLSHDVVTCDVDRDVSTAYC